MSRNEFEDGWFAFGVPTQVTSCDLCGKRAPCKLMGVVERGRWTAQVGLFCRVCIPTERVSMEEFQRLHGNVRWCDFCLHDGYSSKATYDGKTRFGPWAFMCQAHFDEYGVGLGVGKGQELEVGP